jgi:hypothetical protein
VAGIKVEEGRVGRRGGGLEEERLGKRKRELKMRGRDKRMKRN